MLKMRFFASLALVLQLLADSVPKLEDVVGCDLLEIELEL